MPFKMTDYLEAQVLNLVLNGIPYTPPSSVYLGLFTAFTEADDGLTYFEVSPFGTGYARVPVTFSAFTGGTSSNNLLTDFPMALSDWGQITYCGIFDDPNAGNLLYWGPVLNPPTVLANQQFEIQPAQLVVTISGTISTYLANKLGEHTLRNNAYTPPASHYLSVFTAFTSDTVYTELIDANYARQLITFTTPFDTTTTIQNAIQVSFPGAVNPYTANYVAIFDAVTSGNMLLRGPLNPPKALAAGKPFVFPAGNITCTAD